MIRVFARRTKMTPTDDRAFYAEPPLFDVPDEPVYVSVTFTWDIPRGFQLYEAWRKKRTMVLIGGPAFGNCSPSFEVGAFLKRGVTITSRGCIRKCPWCRVPDAEGDLWELTVIQPGNIVQDNNLLACSRVHIERVFEMLKGQPRAAVFAGGLDTRLLQPWHVDALKSHGFRLGEAWFAADTPESIDRLNRVRDLMADFPLRKKRCYVLAGFAPEDTPAATEHRCEQILAKGFCPFVMLYQPTNRRTYSSEWKAAQRKWSRPAAYLSKAPAAIERRAP